MSRLPQGLACKGYPDGRMDDPVQHGIGYRLLADGVMPHLHRDLGRDDRGLGVVAVVDDIHQQASGDVVERRQGEVVQDEQVGPLDALEVPEDLP